MNVRFLVLGGMILVCRRINGSHQSRRRSPSTRKCEGIHPVDETDIDCTGMRWNLIVSYFPAHVGLQKLERATVFSADTVVKLGKRMLVTAESVGDAIRALNPAADLLADATGQLGVALASGLDHMRQQVNDRIDIQTKGDLNKLKALIVESLENLSTVSEKKIDSYVDAVMKAVNGLSVNELGIMNSTLHRLAGRQANVQNSMTKTASLLRDSEERVVLPKFKDLGKRVEEGEEMLSQLADGLTNQSDWLRLGSARTLVDSVDGLKSNLTQVVRELERKEDLLLGNISHLAAAEVEQLNRDGLTDLSSAVNKSADMVRGALSSTARGRDLVHTAITGGWKNLTVITETMETKIINRSRLSSEIGADFRSAVRVTNNSVLDAQVALGDAQEIVNMDFINQVLRANQSIQAVAESSGRIQSLFLDELRKAIDRERSGSRESLEKATNDYLGRIVDVARDASGQGTGLAGAMQRLAKRNEVPEISSPAIDKRTADLLLNDLEQVLAKSLEYQTDYDAMRKGTEAVVGSKIAASKNLVDEELGKERFQPKISELSFDKIAGLLSASRALGTTAKAQNAVAAMIDGMRKLNEEMLARLGRQIAQSDDQAIEMFNRETMAVLAKGLKTVESGLYPSNVVRETFSTFHSKQERIDKHILGWERIQEEQTAVVERLQRLAKKLDLNVSSEEEWLGKHVSGITDKFESRTAGMGGVFSIPVLNKTELGQSIVEEMRKMLGVSGSVINKSSVLEDRIVGLNNRSSSLQTRGVDVKRALESLRGYSGDGSKTITNQLSQVLSGLQTGQSVGLLDSLIETLTHLRMTTTRHLTHLKHSVEREILKLPGMIRLGFVDTIRSSDLTRNISRLLNGGTKLHPIRPLGVLSKLQQLQSEYLDKTERLHSELQQTRMESILGFSRISDGLERLLRELSDTRRAEYRDMDSEAFASETRRLLERLESVQSLWVKKVLMESEDHAAVANLEIAKRLEREKFVSEWLKNRGENAEQMVERLRERGGVLKRSELKLKHDMEQIKGVAEAFETLMSRPGLAYADKRLQLEASIVMRNTSQSLLAILKSPIFDLWFPITDYFHRVNDLLSAVNQTVDASMSAVDKFRSSINEQIVIQEAFEREWLGSLLHESSVSDRKRTVDVNESIASLASREKNTKELITSIFTHS